ncbi:hypothetical protein KP509_04G049500 [Ceratopteris richardii]|uniref:Uncharacterized protein n=1 Tax=Ceratopteris richardii TaxID=49495 RepID=A0A8T2UWT7_CERRI|nr:hypothetical protein KP509_04G049500 [Ceratopteris richardii]
MQEKRMHMNAKEEKLCWKGHPSSPSSSCSYPSSLSSSSSYPSHSSLRSSSLSSTPLTTQSSSKKGKLAYDLETEEHSKRSIRLVQIQKSIQQVEVDVNNFAALVQLLTGNSEKQVAELKMCSSIAERVEQSRDSIPDTESYSFLRNDSLLQHYPNPIIVSESPVEGPTIAEESVRSMHADSFSYIDYLSASTEYSIPHVEDQTNTLWTARSLMDYLEGQLQQQRSGDIRHRPAFSDVDIWAGLTSNHPVPDIDMLPPLLL